MMSHVDNDPMVRRALRPSSAPQAPAVPTVQQEGPAPSAFFWWIRALLAAVGAAAVFPVFFALVVRVLHSLPA